MRDAVHRLETVPGVGPIVALTAIAVFADVSRFGSAKHAASYSGLVPSTFQSGDRDCHGHITKRGSAELRTGSFRLFGLSCPGDCSQDRARGSDGGEDSMKCRRSHGLRSHP